MPFPTCVALVTASGDEIAEGSIWSLLESFDPGLVKAVILARAAQETEIEALRCHSAVADVSVSGALGISAARNRLIERLISLGAPPDQIVCFPDDDCRYPTGFMQALEPLLADSDLVLGGYSSSGMVDTSEVAPLTGSVCFRVANSVGIFVRFGALLSVGGFDENLGVGSGVVEAAEDLDLLVALNCMHIRRLYVPRLRAIHPEGESLRPERQGSHIVVARRYARKSPAAAWVLLRSAVGLIVRPSMARKDQFARLMRPLAPRRITARSSKSGSKLI